MAFCLSYKVLPSIPLSVVITYHVIWGDRCRLTMHLIFGILVTHEESMEFYSWFDETFVQLDRLQHKQNKGVRQSHALSQNSEAIDMWKVSCHPPSRHVEACDDYTFKNAIVFFLLQWHVWTIIKLKLKQASKEY